MGHLLIFFVSSHVVCRLGYLRQEFGHPVPDPNDADLMRAHTAAFIMELIGTLIVPDSSKDCVPSMYAQFINFEHPQRYSWASALLACLYRNLCYASRGGSKSIAGPLYFLQVQFGTPIAFFILIFIS